MALLLEVGDIPGFRVVPVQTGDEKCDGRRAAGHRVSGLVYAREGVPFAGRKSLSELATAP